MNPTDQEIYDYLTKDKGLSHNHAMGMLNNIKHESNNNPGVKGDYMIADPSGNLKNKERLVYQKSDGTWYYSRFHPTKARQDVEAEHLDNIDATAGGLFQHQGSRNSAMKEYVGDDWETDWKGQIDFAIQEPETKKYLDKDFDSPEDASRDFTVNWERPADSANVAQTRVDTIGNINIQDVEIIEDDQEVSGTYDDWKGVEPGDHENGDIIKVGDKHYEYQSNRASYAPYNLETGETEDLVDGNPRLVTEASIGTNPSYLPNGSANPNYRKNRNEEGQYVYNNMDDVKKGKAKLKDGDELLVDGKVYKYDGETKDLIAFSETGEMDEANNVNVESIGVEDEVEIEEEDDEEVIEIEEEDDEEVADPEDEPEQIDLEKYNANQKRIKDSKYKSNEEWDSAVTKAEKRLEKEKNKRVLIGGTYDDEGYLSGYSAEQVDRAEKELAEAKEGRAQFVEANDYNSNFTSDDPATEEVWEGVEGSEEHIAWQEEREAIRVSIEEEENRRANLNPPPPPGPSTVENEGEDGQETTIPFVNSEGEEENNGQQGDVVVLDEEGNEVVIPTGEEVTTQELDESQGGNREYESWEEVHNDPNLDRSETITVGGNQYKWKVNEGAAEGSTTDGRYMIVDENGEFVPDENNEIQLIAQEPAIEASTTPEDTVLIANERGEYSKNLNGEWVHTDPSTGTTTIVSDPATLETLEGTIEQPAEVEVEVEEQVDVNGAEIEDVSGDSDFKQKATKALKTMGELGEGLITGASSLLDAVGGPGAIVSYLMGKESLKDAMKEVTPKQKANLSASFMEHLRQTKELQKRGFHPTEARKVQKEIDTAYQVGLENSIRGTAGDRAKFLAQSGILDAKRSSALLEYSVKDAELQRTNQTKYTAMLNFKENFDAQRSEALRAEDMKAQQEKQKAASEFTGQMFKNVMSGLGGNKIGSFFQQNQAELTSFVDHITKNR